MDMIIVFVCVVSLYVMYVNHGILDRASQGEGRREIESWGTWRAELTQLPHPASSILLLLLLLLEVVKYASCPSSIVPIYNLDYSRLTRHACQRRGAHQPTESALLVI
jgi:hypothetical protein